MNLSRRVSYPNRGAPRFEARMNENSTENTSSQKAEALQGYSSHLRGNVEHACD